MQQQRRQRQAQERQPGMAESYARLLLVCPLGCCLHRVAHFSIGLYEHRDTTWQASMRMCLAIMHSSMLSQRAQLLTSDCADCIKLGSESLLQHIFQLPIDLSLPVLRA